MSLSPPVFTLVFNHLYKKKNLYVFNKTIFELNHSAGLFLTSEFPEGFDRDLDTQNEAAPGGSLGVLSPSRTSPASRGSGFASDVAAMS